MTEDIMPPLPPGEAPKQKRVFLRFFRKKEIPDHIDSGYGYEAHHDIPLLSKEPPKHPEAKATSISDDTIENIRKQLGLNEQPLKGSVDEPAKIKPMEPEKDLSLEIPALDYTKAEKTINYKPKSQEIADFTKDPDIDEPGKIAKRSASFSEDIKMIGAKAKIDKQKTSTPIQPQKESSLWTGEAHDEPKKPAAKQSDFLKEVPSKAEKNKMEDKESDFTKEITATALLRKKQPETKAPAAKKESLLEQDDEIIKEVAKEFGLETKTEAETGLKKKGKEKAEEKQQPKLKQKEKVVEDNKPAPITQEKDDWDAPIDPLDIPRREDFLKKPKPELKEAEEEKADIVSSPGSTDINDPVFSKITPEKRKKIEKELKERYKNKMRAEERKKLEQAMKKEKEALKKEKQGVEHLKIALAGRENKLSFREKHVYQTKEEMDDEKKELIKLREETEEAREKIRKERAEADEYIKKLPKLRKDYDQLVKDYEKVQAKMVHFGDKIRLNQQLEENLKKREEALQSVQKNIEEIETRMKAGGFSEYLEATMTGSDLLPQKQTTLEENGEKNVQLYDMINECKSLIWNDHIDEAKKLYMTIRDSYPKIKMANDEKEMLFATIREIYDDINLASLK